MKVNMQFTALAIGITLLAAQSDSVAQNLGKRGLPCVAEICVGDGIEELTKIQWVPAQNPIKIGAKIQPTSAHSLTDDDLKMLRAIYPSAGEAAPYLHERQFDAGALAVLPRVEAACQSNELIGNFGAGTSTPTRVGISLMPSATDPSKQVWTVTTITREFPTAVGNEQRAEITKLLNMRYAHFGAGRIEGPNAKPGEGRFFPSGMTRFGFGLSLIRSPDEANRMKLHPACSGLKAS